MKKRWMTGYMVATVVVAIWLIYSVRSGWWPQSDWLTVPLAFLAFVGGMALSQARLPR